MFKVQSNNFKRSKDILKELEFSKLEKRLKNKEIKSQKNSKKIQLKKRNLNAK